MNPLVFAGVDRIESRLARRTEVAPLPTATPPSTDDGRPSPRARKNHSVLVGYGRVGSVVGTALMARGEPFVGSGGNEPGGGGGRGWTVVAVCGSVVLVDCGWGAVYAF